MPLFCPQESKAFLAGYRDLFNPLQDGCMPSRRQRKAHVEAIANSRQLAAVLAARGLKVQGWDRTEPWDLKVITMIAGTGIWICRNRTRLLRLDLKANFANYKAKLITVLEREHLQHILIDRCDLELQIRNSNDSKG